MGMRVERPALGGQSHMLRVVDTDDVDDDGGVDDDGDDADTLYNRDKQPQAQVQSCRI